MVNSNIHQLFSTLNVGQLLDKHRHEIVCHRVQTKPIGTVYGRGTEQLARVLHARHVVKTGHRPRSSVARVLGGRAMQCDGNMLQFTVNFK